MEKMEPENPIDSNPESPDADTNADETIVNRDRENSLTNGNQQTTRKKNHGNCKSHPTEIYRMHCEDCDCLVCEDCIIGPHKQHVFNKIANIAMEVKKQELIKCMSKTREEKLFTLKEVIEDITENQQDYVRQTDVILQHMQERSDAIKTEIDTVYMDMVTEMKQKAKEDIDSLKKKKLELESLLTDLKKSVKECEIRTQKMDTKRGSANLNFIMDTKNKLTNYEMCPEHVPIMPPSFTPSTNIDQNILRTMIGQFGNKGVADNGIPSGPENLHNQKHVNGENGQVNGEKRQTNSEHENTNSEHENTNSKHENANSETPDTNNGDKQTSESGETNQYHSKEVFENKSNADENESMLDDIFNNACSVERRILKVQQKSQVISEESTSKTTGSNGHGSRSKNPEQPVTNGGKKSVTWQEQERYKMDEHENDEITTTQTAHSDNILKGNHGDIQFEVLDVIDTTRTFGNVASKCLTPIDHQNVWLGNGSRKEIGLINNEGEYQECIKTDFMFETMSITQSGQLVVADYDSCMLKKITESDEFEIIIDLSPFKINCMCVTDTNEILCGLVQINKNGHKNAKVLRLTSKGETMNTYQLKQNGKQLFTEPYSITQTSTHDVWIADDNMEESSPIKVITGQGKYKFTYNGPEGSDMDRGFYPYNILCDNNDRILVSDSKNHAIQLVSSSGRFLQLVTLKDDHVLSHPSTIAKDNEGNFWIQCSNNKIFIVFYDEYDKDDDIE